MGRREFRKSKRTEFHPYRVGQTASGGQDVNRNLADTFDQGESLNNMQVDNVSDDSEYSEEEPNIIVTLEESENDASSYCSPHDSDSSSEEVPIVDGDEQSVDYGNNEIYEDYLTLRHVAQSTSDTALTCVIASLKSRETYEDFLLRMCTYDKPIREEAKRLRNHLKSKVQKFHLCNQCGKFLRKDQKCASCDGVSAELIRLPLADQLDDLVGKYYKSIVDLRNVVKNGENKVHNLNGKCFKTVLDDEKPDELNLSLIASLDGVRVDGKKRKHIWPMGFVLVDLPTEEMIKGDNVILAAIVSCDTTISTKVWNKVWCMVNKTVSILEFDMDQHVVDFRIATVVADQPAKRVLFGLKSYHSAESCCYCLSQSTLYKLNGSDRQLRGHQQTVRDNISKLHGFREFATINESLPPYISLVDVFHNEAEGIFYVVIEESRCDPDKRKSSMFACDGDKFKLVEDSILKPEIFKKDHELRNGNAKFNYFRMTYFLNAICSSTFAPLGRLVIIGLGMIANMMSSNNTFEIETLKAICCSLDNLLNQEHLKYFTIKLHETIFHMPTSCEMFGNIQALSTCQFETYWRILVSDIKKSVTIGFLDLISERFITQVGANRELERRLISKNITPNASDFARQSKKFPSSKEVFSHRVNPAYMNIADTSIKCYAILRSKMGRFKSSIMFPESSDVIMFFKNHPIKCGRFLCGLERHDGRKTALVEVLEETREQFDKLGRDIKSLPPYQREEGEKIIKIMRTSRFISNGKFRKKRQEIDLDSISGIGCALQKGLLVTCVQLTGAIYHV